MRFRGHETFFIRKGWLYKGMKNVVADATVFMGNNGNPMDILGIGSNMVKALRYWLQVVGLTAEPTSGKRYQQLTPLGEIIYHNDKYIEEMGTLWLLQYKLASNRDDATAWYYFFNEFNRKEFTKEDFIKQLNSYIILNGSEVSERSLEDDFNCIINTYVPRIKSNPGKVHPESNIDCPLGELSLIDFANKKAKVYRKSVPKIDTIHPLIALAIIVDQAKGNKQVRISSIQSDSCNIGKLFNLDVIALTSLLSKLELLEYIKVIRTAGLDVVNIEKEIDFLGCVIEYYKAINQ